MAEITSGDVVVMVLTPVEADHLAAALESAVEADESGAYAAYLHDVLEALGVLG
jgi:citrate lyase gamma subunit